jgi:hypothetical protein
LGSTLRVQVRQQLGQGIRKVGLTGWARDRAELARQVQVVRDGPLFDAHAVQEADDVDLAEGEGPLVGARPMNSPVWRPWKVQ